MRELNGHAGSSPGGNLKRKLNMPTKGKSGERKQPAKKNEHDKRTQKTIGAWLKSLLAMIMTGLRWKNEQQAPVTITPLTDGKGGSNPAYQISVRDVATGLADRGKAMLSSLANRFMNAGNAPEAEPAAADDEEVSNPYMVATMKLLTKLSRLKRYIGMEIIKVDSTTLRVVMTGDKPVHLVFTKADLAKLRRMAVKSRGAKAVEGWAEYNLCLQLVMMQGLLPVAKQGGKTLMGVVAHSPKNAKFHQQTLIAAVYLDNNGELTWERGEKATRAFSKGVEVPLHDISKALGRHSTKDKDGKTRKGFKFEGRHFKRLNQTNGSFVIKRKDEEMLAAAKEAGVFKKWKNLTFAKVHIQHYSEAAAGQNTVWGLLSSMTNGTSKGDKGHIKVKSKRSWFHNISMKRLLAGYPEEIALLNKENQQIVADIREALGLSDYRIPAVYLTSNKDWSHTNHDHLVEAMNSHAFMALGVSHDPNTAGRRKGDVPEVLSHPEANRWWNHTGIAWSIGRSDLSYSAEGDENSFELLELIVTAAAKPQQTEKSAE